MNSWLVALSALGLTLGPLTCLDGDEPTESVSTAFSQARRLWVEDCADCHGVTGGADGQKSAALNPPAPEFRDPCRKISDAWIERVIVSGGSSFRGSEAMRSYHELEEEPEVLGELVSFVQSLRESGDCTAKREARAPAKPQP